MDGHSTSGTATDRLDSRAAIARYVGVHPSYVPVLVDRGLPVTRIAKEFRSSKPLIDDWFEKQALGQVGVRDG